MELPDGWADIAVTTERLEDSIEWRGILKNILRTTKEGGLMLITCAGPLRPTHGAGDSDSASSPLTTDYYKNLGPTSFARWSGS